MVGVATKRTAAGLTKEEVEQFTDVMVGKLAHLAYTRSPDLPPGEIGRDEVRQVVIDTSLLVSGKVPMERWLDGGA